MTDFLYYVNDQAELFQVDLVDGAYTVISNMPMGSYIAAIDQENKMLYSVGRSSPYPLMKYNIVTEEWTTIKNLGFGGPRLEYHDEEESLYFANNSILKIIDPVNGNTLSTWSIVGLDSGSGGDLAFNPNGVIFMCTYSV